MMEVPRLYHVSDLFCDPKDIVGLIDSDHWAIVRLKGNKQVNYYLMSSKNFHLMNDALEKVRQPNEKLLVDKPLPQGTQNWSSLGDNNISSIGEL